LRFAKEQDITRSDEDLGYTLHAWFAALFGELAPKPFRLLERRQQVLAYAKADTERLLAHAQAFASPEAFAALDLEGFASKPMPATWRPGQRLHVEVRVCPISRQADTEKDVYLRALDRLGAEAPPRAEVYCQWFVRQWNGAAVIEHVQLLGMKARSRLLRRARNGYQRLRLIERPEAVIGAEAVIADPQRFAELLARGIGRHRAFGFGMILLAPPR
jgi:CRISPR system Cascade subunit CasE